MKSLKKLISKSLLAITLMFATSFAANAGLINITHDINDLDGFKLGSIQVQIDESLLNTGFLDTAFGDEITLININLSDLLSWGDVFDIFDFGAVIDSDNIYAGIEFFEFDADDVGFGLETWSYYMTYDAFGLSYLEIFDLSGNAIFETEFTLGAAQVVSAPSTIALFTLAMGGLLIRRRRIV
ncbi:PEP-CTERM protein-sorting domain-containing protein [Arsukibacterium tuosuense]|uniref:PEP-CTERM protein-sorting domain-containing protein n=1 Tax=Arsukibacterium tuosuense TaxID=1323745 RepID=A0A285J4Y2_9GAMM|nr:PEP-CTERM sorting domain-containing protein [Arsukibacterium tuosuense]SNY55123.1 PEP-CTERM protein-sorting domain-containing protein [Arsukibacterium tuosuense]